MTWRDDLRVVDFSGKKLVGASFRGVSFFVETVELSTGRRLVVHEFPLRDNPFIEDIGRRARKFRVDGYLIGDDYLTQKTALLDALEAEGPGTLILPYYPTKTALGETTSVRETRAEGAYAVVSVEFVEAPAQAIAPTIEADTVGIVAARAAAAHAGNQAQFVADYKPDNLPAFALASAQTALTRATAALSDKLAPLIADQQELATFNGQVAVMTAEAAALVTQPLVVVDQFLTTITNLTTTAEAAPGAVVNALVDAYNTDMGALTAAVTATRVRELANQVAIQGALRRTLATEASRLAPTVQYATIEDATAARDSIAGLLDDQAQTAGDTAYPAIVDLRSQLLRAVPGSSIFRRVVALSQRATIPSLVLAHRLYGSVDLEQDVVARNRVAHPGFVVGELKVLSAATP